MTTTKKIIMAVLAVVLVYVIYLLLTKGMQKKVTSTSTHIDTTGDDAGAQSGTSILDIVGSVRSLVGSSDAEFPLKWGSQNSKVKKLQQYYNTNRARLLSAPDGLAPAAIAEDGIWGKDTEAAVAALKNYAATTTYIEPVAAPTNDQSHWQISSKEDFEGLLSVL